MTKHQRNRLVVWSSSHGLVSFVGRASGSSVNVRASSGCVARRMPQWFRSIVWLARTCMAFYGEGNFSCWSLSLFFVLLSVQVMTGWLSPRLVELSISRCPSRPEGKRGGPARSDQALLIWHETKEHAPVVTRTNRRWGVRRATTGSRKPKNER